MHIRFSTAVAEGPGAPAAGAEVDEDRTTIRAKARLEWIVRMASELDCAWGEVSILLALTIIEHTKVSASAAVHELARATGLTEAAALRFVATLLDKGLCRAV